jgi:hypothetical protein
MPSRKKTREPDVCPCGQTTTDENWRIHHDHWIESVARQYVAEGRPMSTVGTAFRPAMQRLRAQGIGVTHATKGGTVLTPDVVAALADEAEAGYDINKLVPRPQGEQHTLEQRTTAELLGRIEQLRKLLDVEPKAGELFSTINERLFRITQELAKVHAELTRRAGVLLQLLEVDLS